MAAKWKVSVNVTQIVGHVREAMGASKSKSTRKNASKSNGTGGKASTSNGMEEDVSMSNGTHGLTTSEGP